jgi:hypothetical protein
MILFKNKSKKSVLIRFSLLIPLMLLAFPFQSKKPTQDGKEPLVVVNNPVISSGNIIDTRTPTFQSDTLIFTSVEEAPQPAGGYEEF